jgi:hypothetical protein
MSTIFKTEALKAHSPASRGQTPSHPSPRDVHDYAEPIHEQLPRLCCDWRLMDVHGKVIKELLA